jgi:hypothetical protein
MLPESWHQCYTDFFSRPLSGWNHEQLIQVAAVALQQDSSTALQRLRGQLAQIGPGYHETLTGCWLELLRLATVEGLAPKALAARLSFSQLPFAYYTPALLGSPEAALRHLAPDLRPVQLPRVLPEELNDTLVAFQSRRLTKADWTHRCHLRVAGAIQLLLGQQGMHVMSTGIQRLNQAHEVPLTPTGGYHETLTRLWYRLVGLAVERTGLQEQPAEPERWVKFYEYLDDKQLPLRFYSRERLLSWEARIGWLEPDLGPVDLV